MFNPAKSLQAIKYLSQQMNMHDLTKVYNVLFQADLLHAQKHGRFITGDLYQVNESGAHPSSTHRHLFEKFRTDLEGTNGVLGSSVDMDEFSQSDIECLDAALEMEAFFPLANKGAIQ